MSEVSLTPIRACTKCGVTKPLTSQFFHRKNGGREIWKFQPSCKVCRNLYNAAYHAEDPDRQKRYRQRTVAERCAYQKAYYEANRQRIKAQTAEYKQKNPDKARAAVRRWNREHKAEKLVHSRRYKASKRAATGMHTATEVWELAEAQDWLCAYCEKPLFGEFHVDHMQPLSRAGSDDWKNLAITCVECNLRKGSKTAVEFMLWMAA